MTNQKPTVEGGDDHQGQIETADRGIPQVGRKKGGSRIWYIIVVGVMIVLIAALASMAALNKLKSRKSNAGVHTDTVTSNPRNLTEEAFATSDTPPALPPDIQPIESSPGQPAPLGQPTGRAKLTPEQQKANDLVERRKRAPLVAVSASLAAGSSSGVDGGSGNGFGNASGTLGRSLQATRMGAVSATMLADPNMTITQGHLLGCTLETAMSSDVPGMTSCVLTRNIYSTNGRVLLLERGTRLVGQYQSGQLRRGQNRIFMLWTRAETPNGVLINLDSPASDALGRSGVDGKLNRHFWERFGAALLVSVVDDLSSYVAAQQSENSDGDSITYDSTSSSSQDAAAIIVANSVNIPPTLNKAQGASVGVFVARDLYFGDVYSLQPKGG